LIRKIALNTAALISGQVAVKGLGLFWMIVVARHLGEAGFGTLNLGLTLGGLFGLLVEFGFSPVLTRAVAREPGLAAPYLANVTGLRLLLAAGVVPLTVAAAGPLGAARADLPVFAMLSVTAVTAALWAVPNSLFVARERMLPPAVIQTAAKIAAMAVGLWLIARGAGLPALAAVFVLEGVIQVTAGYTAAARLLGLPVRVAMDRDFCRRLFRDSAPFVLTLALGLIYFKVDVLMLSVMKGSVAVGRYSAAFRLLEGLVYLAAAYAGALFPTIARLKTESPERLRVAAHRATDVVVAAALPAAVALAMLAEPVMHLLYGAEFAESVAALRWIGAALVFVFVSNFLGSVLGAVDRQGWTFRATVVGVVINVTLNLWLIPRLAHVGAAAATLVTQAAVTAVLVVLVRRAVGPRPAGLRVVRIALATALMAIVLHLLRESGLAVLVPAGAAAYLVGIAVTRVLHAHEVDCLRAAIGNLARSRRL
jgi:O-antigen/teichoic acid export membrane protein